MQFFWSFWIPLTPAEGKGLSRVQKFLPWPLPLLTPPIIGGFETPDNPYAHASATWSFHLQPKSTILLTLSGLQIHHLVLELLKTIPSSPSTFPSEMCSQQSFVVMGYWGKYWVGSMRRGCLPLCFRIGVDNWQWQEEYSLPMYVH